MWGILAEVAQGAVEVVGGWFVGNTVLNHLERRATGNEPTIGNAIKDTTQQLAKGVSHLKKPVNAQVKAPTTET